MITFSDENMALFIRSQGKFFRVTAICASDEEANAYCAANPEEGVIAEDKQQGRVYVAEALLLQEIKVKGGEERDPHSLSETTQQRIVKGLAKYSTPKGFDPRRCAMLAKGAFITAKADGTRPPAFLVCAQCGASDPEDFRVASNTVVTRSVMSYSPGTVKASGMIDEYANEESENDDRIECKRCGAEIRIPGLEYDYV